MAGDIKLKIGADISEFSRELDALVKKLKSVEDQIGSASKKRGGPSAPPESPGSQTFQKAFQATRAQEDKTRKEQLAQDIAKRKLEEIDRQLAINARTQSKSDREKNDAESQRNNLLKERITLQGTLNRLEGRTATGDRVPGTQTVGGKGMPAGGITSLQGLAAFLGVPGMVMGGAATAVAGGMAAEKLRSLFGEASYRAAEKSAAAYQTQGQGGQRIESFLSGGAPEEIMFNQQRTQAAGKADEIMKQRLESSWRLFSRPYETIFGKRKYTGTGINKQSEQMGWGTADTEAEVESQQALERAAEQSKQFEAITKGPSGALRTGLAHKYLRDYQRDIGFQRQMGLSDTGFREGFKGGIFGAGFSEEQGMGMATSIMGAGGSTRAATGSAAMALQAQRNLDITNAGTLMGKLSGTMGDTKTTNEAFVKILAEGTRLGLDGSEYREENRKFIETAAQVVNQSGATTGAGVDQLMEQIGKFFGDKTTRGLEAGKGAYDLYREMSMESTGPRGAMRAAGILSDPNLRKMGRDSRQVLMDMPVDQLTPDNPLVQSMAREAGGKTTAQDIIDSMGNVNAAAANQFKRSDMLRDRLTAARKKYAMGSMSAVGYKGPGEAEIAQDLQDLMVAQAKEHPSLAQDWRKNQAFSDAQGIGNRQKMLNDVLRDDEAVKKSQLGAATTGRAADETEKLQAEASKMANQLFIDMRAEIVPTATSVAEFAKQCAALRAILQDPHATMEQKARAATNMGNLIVPTQPTAGQSTPGAH